MNVTEARLALTAYREGKGLSFRKAAIEIGVSHVQLIAWESGTQTPTESYRKDIEKWSKGRIKASSWPLSKSEQRRALNKERAKKNTGTDG